VVVPYEQLKHDEFIIRTFDINTNDDELVWHRDKSNRIIIPVEGEDWQFQFDNELPITIRTFNTIIIDKNKYHRIIKGSTNLKIYILEYSEILDSGSIKKIIDKVKNEYNKNI